MTNIEFLYWLQGYFEILEDNTLNMQQILTIKRHLNLVLAVEKEVWPFPSYLKELFEVSDNEVLKKQKEIAEKLNNIFEHVVKV